MRQLPDTVFCSDFHLKDAPEECPFITDFFKNIEKKYEAVVILGDLFNSWWGDDHRNRIYQAWERFFKELQIDCYFLAGNRDFLIGNAFFERSNMTPLRSGEIISIGGKKIALFHGDEPGLRDSWYQIWRAFSRHLVTQKIFLTLPVMLREYIATKLRKSRENNPQESSFSELEIDVSQWLLICSEKPHIIINGHLHFPLWEKYQEGLERYQLGCWDNGEHSFLVVSQDGSVEHCHSKKLSIREKLEALRPQPL